MYAQVILSTVHTDIDKIFDYKVPPELSESIYCGMRVLVPFGFRNTSTEGYVTGLGEYSEVPEQKMKQIIRLLDNRPVFSAELISLAIWMKEKYYCTLSQCLLTIMPSGIQSKTQWIAEVIETENLPKLTEKEIAIYEFVVNEGGSCARLEIEREFEKCSAIINSLVKKRLLKMKQLTIQKEYLKKVRMVSLCIDEYKLDEERELLMQNKKSQSQLLILERLKNEKEGMVVSDLIKELEISMSPVQSLQKKGILKIIEQEQKRDAFDIDKFSRSLAMEPTEEQEKAISFLKNQLENKSKKTVLLHGITGSGKTEIYLQLIEEVLKKGQQAIVLVPEISLTPLMVGRFISRFGKKVSVTHSKMNYGERYDQWKKARDEEISIMIGPRSAIFTPFENLGVVIIDEEHETSYQSETTPKYNAKEVAQKRSQLCGALVVLGSATPDLLSYYKAVNGEYNILKLKNRAKESQLPEVFTIDMRQELEKGNRSIFSRALYEAINENLQKKEQTMLFLNRRGFSTFVSCRKCGHVMMCDNCNVSYTYHSGNGELVCHYCGKKIKNPEVCPECGSKYIRYFGTGTQKVETEVKKLFPLARVLRMDLDTTKKKHSAENILEQFGNQQADILVGTQMIAKGHDFPNVTLVGIVAADLSLHNGDYRGAETTFQLITQTAGRAGRDKKSGRVFIQTYLPEHYGVAQAASQDYEAFYAKEIEIRQMMEYPPFSSVAVILLSGKNEKNVIEAAHRFFDILYGFNRKGNFTLLGPSPASISKIKNEFRWRILIKCKEEDRLRAYTLYCIEKFSNGQYKDVMLNLSLNPFVIV